MWASFAPLSSFKLLGDQSTPGVFDLLLMHEAQHCFKDIRMHLPRRSASNIVVVVSLAAWLRNTSTVSELR